MKNAHKRLIGAVCALLLIVSSLAVGGSGTYIWSSYLQARRKRKEVPPNQ